MFYWGLKGLTTKQIANINVIINRKSDIILYIELLLYITIIAISVFINLWVINAIPLLMHINVIVADWQMSKGGKFTLDPKVLARFTNCHMKVLPYVIIILFALLMFGIIKVGKEIILAIIIYFAFRWMHMNFSKKVTKALYENNKRK